MIHNKQEKIAIFFDTIGSTSREIEVLPIVIKR